MTGSTPGPTTLVVGSYPPVRTAGMAATLATVRRLVAEGADVAVASPRTSAARYDVTVSGLLAGRRLEQLRVATGATRLVLCAEPDLPVPASWAVPALLPAVQRRTVEELRRAAGRFEHVTLVLAADLHLPADLEAQLRATAHEVVDERALADPWPGVSVLEPDERSPREQLVDLARKVARRALGPAAPRVRRVLADTVRTLRSVSR